MAGYRRRRRYRRAQKRFKRYARHAQNVYTAWGSAKFLASRALKGVNYIRGLVNAEMFKHDVANTNSNLLNTGVLNHLTGIAIGDSAATRTGNSIFVRCIDIKGYVVWNSAAAIPQVIRISVLCDKQQIGDQTPAYSDVYGSGDVNSFLNASNVGRFTILRTFQVVVDSSNTRNRQFRILYKCRQHVRYNGANDTDIQKCGIYLCLVSSQATENGPTVVTNARISYHDN